MKRFFNALSVVWMIVLLSVYLSKIITDPTPERYVWRLVNHSNV